MKRLDLWLAKLKVALAEQKFLAKRMHQANRAYSNNIKQIEIIKGRIGYEKAKLASTK